MGEVLKPPAPNSHPWNSKGVSPEVKGNLYKAFVEADDSQRLERTKTVMFSWKCRTSLNDRHSVKELRIKLTVTLMSDIMRCWYRPVIRKAYSNWLDNVKGFKFCGTSWGDIFQWISTLFSGELA